ncbi:hypothetical protein QF032_001367 [Streptomyces achromogenes]|uniref:hypothetical protein n=1 Tax=Streptomyces achromogenes TaxID=67255 RepID=UPI00278261AB|nr:hypothetical protein [Streptomyces achromogenes]MDQ0829523.1 hypothetical protein [Streptomyces achromogenes]
MPEPTTEDLERTRAQLQDEVREARGLLQDLRHEIKTARELVPLLAKERFEAEVKKQVAELAEATKEAMDRAVTKVNTSFENLAATLLGEDRASRRKGAVPLPDLFRARSVLDAARTERQQRQR